MIVKSMRLAGVLIALAAPAAAAAQAVDVAAVHARAVDIYVRTGDVTRAVMPLQNWKPDDFDRAIAALVATGDVVRMQAAAVFHLDIGVALVGLSPISAKLHIDLGDHLLNKVRDTFKEPARIKEHDAFRAVYLAVAGSAFVSVREIRFSLPYVNEARDLAPQSAHVATVYGIAQEIDGLNYNPDDAATLSQRDRLERERIIRLGRAEKAYRDALQLDSHYAIASIRLGRVLQIIGKLKDARQSLDRGVADARGAFEEYLGALFLGGLLEETKDLSAARQSYERALAIVPLSQPAIVGLAHVEVMSGRPDRAQEIVRQFTSARVDTWWAYNQGALDLTGLSWLRERTRQ